MRKCEVRIMVGMLTNKGLVQKEQKEKSNQSLMEGTSLLLENSSRLDHRSEASNEC